MYYVIVTTATDDYKRVSVNSLFQIFQTEAEVDEWISLFYLQELSDRCRLEELDEEHMELLDKKEFNAFNEKVEELDWSGEYILEPLNVQKEKLTHYAYISEADSSRMAALIEEAKEQLKKEI